MPIRMFIYVLYIMMIFEEKTTSKVIMYIQQAVAPSPPAPVVAERIPSVVYFEPATASLYTNKTEIK